MEHPGGKTCTGSSGEVIVTPSRRLPGGDEAVDTGARNRMLNSAGESWPRTDVDASPAMTAATTATLATREEVTMSLFFSIVADDINDI